MLTDYDFTMPKIPKRKTKECAEKDFMKNFMNNFKCETKTGIHERAQPGFRLKFNTFSMDI